MKKGGTSAADYGKFVWGSPAEQHAVLEAGNLIQASGDPTKFKGGKRSKKNRSGGDGIITATAVPALLITANHFYKRKSNKTRKPVRKNMKIIGGANESEGGMIMDVLKQQMKQIDNLNTTAQNLLPGGNPNNHPPVNSNTTEIKSGGKGIFETIAVPTILVSANHLYRSRKKRKHNKNVRFSMKKR